MIPLQYCRDKGIPLLRIPYTYDAVKDKAKTGQFVTDFMQTKAIHEEIKEFYKKFHPATIFYSCWVAFYNYQQGKVIWKEIQND